MLTRKTGILSITLLLCGGLLQSEQAEQAFQPEQPTPMIIEFLKKSTTPDGEDEWKKRLQEDAKLKLEFHSDEETPEGASKKQDIYFTISEEDPTTKIDSKISILECSPPVPNEEIEEAKSAVEYLKLVFMLMQQEQDSGSKLKDECTSCTITLADPVFDEETKRVKIPHVYHCNTEMPSQLLEKLLNTQDQQDQND